MLARATAILAVLMTATALPAPPVLAQAAAQDGDGGCRLSERKKRGSAMLGSMLGSLAGSALGRTRVGSFVPINTLSNVLTDAIACKLDRDEQKQAAAATEAAITRGEGASAEWTSETRANVRGSSTVTQRTASADGGVCMNVTDVVIVEGEETTVSKKMCRAPGASGFTLAQA
jgi:surface antigen